MATSQQEKDRFQANKNSIMARLDSLHDIKRHLSICHASEQTINNTVLSNALTMKYCQSNKK